MHFSASVLMLVATAWLNVAARGFTKQKPLLEQPDVEALVPIGRRDLPPITPTRRDLPPVKPTRKMLPPVSLTRQLPPVPQVSTILERDLSPDMPATIDQRIAQATRDATAEERSLNTAYVIEGDIAVSKNQYRALTDKRSSAFEKRKANVGYWGKKWTDKTIPYKTTNEFNGDQLQVIRAAMEEWERYTCIKFREASSSDSNFINIQNGVGCNSMVGMQGGKQVVNLEYNCRYKEIVIHELGHAMGFWHEQSRPDRDGYISVDLNNMDPNQRYNMDKYGTDKVDNMGIPYDLGSIMQYGQYAFSYNGQPVIYAKDTWWQDKMGTMTSTSFLDLKLMNKYYECSSHCGSKSCPGDGYVDKNCECQCPGWPLKKCDSSEPDGPGYECKDANSRCQEWQGWGECTRNPGFMLTQCKKSCNVCDEFQGRV